ncbi:hypothetical protein ACMD2_01741 [Ananas comosus]|uniref:DUF789 domain-containing protein n=1 Tax=Ananas comosus TaxID=4615 RepID=A0A199VJL0_ANACO|nr:hypothetical protein ACMD2_01741 [Ananas comosus]
MVLSGGSSSLARGHGDDRFYWPPPIRRQHQQQLLQEEQQRAAAAAKAAPPPRQPTPAAPPPEAREVESRAESADSEASKPSPSPSSSPPPPPPPPPPSGNLERFIQSTNLLVQAQYLSKTSMRGWRISDNTESFPYYNLADLWESFKEWSAYGVGVPLVLSGTDYVIQYYVPFLSAIQLYVNKSRPSVSTRRPGEESDGENYQDTSSDASSESESEKLIAERRESLRNTGCADQEGFSSDDSEACNQSQVPIFEYQEYDPPYGRQPLADKISVLATKFPDLKVLRSCDLLPPSWISVAWYPIYRIPTGPTLQDLDACFLTFHSLSTPLKDARSGHPDIYSLANFKSTSADASKKLALPLLGLASYRFRDSIWTSNGLSDQQLAASLLQTADNWLRGLKIDTPDYRFFVSHYNTSLR